MGHAGVSDVAHSNAELDATADPLAKLEAVVPLGGLSAQAGANLARSARRAKVKGRREAKERSRDVQGNLTNTTAVGPRLPVSLRAPTSEATSTPDDTGP
jgi:hypothetical protein